MIKNKFLSFRCDDDFISKLDEIVSELMLLDGDGLKITRGTVIRRLVEELHHKNTCKV